MTHTIMREHASKLHDVAGGVWCCRQQARAINKGMLEHGPTNPYLPVLRGRSWQAVSMPQILPCRIRME